MTLADELRAIASNGLHWSTNEHDRARYDRTLAIAAQLASLADTRTAGEIEGEPGLGGGLGAHRPLAIIGEHLAERDQGAHAEAGHRRRAATEGCMPRQAGLGAGGPRSSALYVPGDRRRTRVPDEALAVAGGPCGGNVPPRPSCVAALPG